MNELVFSTFNFAPAFLGPSFHVLQERIDKGNKVFYVTCHKTFRNCGFNTLGYQYMCDICVSRYEHTKKHISGEYEEVFLKSIINKEDVQQAAAFISKLAAIDKKVFYEDFDLGESVLSSYISKTRDKDLELITSQEILMPLAQDALCTYLALKRFLVNNNIQKVYVFNGRWDHYRAAFRAAQKLGIECIIYENLRPGGYIEYFENSFPHIIKKKQKLIDEHWASNSNEAEKKGIAKKYFDKKRSGEVIVDRSHTALQVKGALPDKLDLNKEIIVLYNSSDDEFAAIGGNEYLNPYFKDQNEGILFVVDLFKNVLKDKILVIRMHPNLKGLNYPFVQELYDLEKESGNIILLRPESEIDSYRLLDIASKVITFGSSVGIEANYWRKPVILLAKTLYYDYDLAYSPENKAGILKLLTDNLSPKPVESSEKIAYYLMEGGINAQYYDFEFQKKYFFKEHEINKMSFFLKYKYKALKLFKVKRFRSAIHH